MQNMFTFSTVLLYQDFSQDKRVASFLLLFILQNEHENRNIEKQKNTKTSVGPQTVKQHFQLPEIELGSQTISFIL